MELLVVLLGLVFGARFPNQDIGLVLMRDSSSCLEIQNSGDLAGRAITVVSIVRSGVVYRGHLAAGASCRRVIWDGAAGEGGLPAIGLLDFKGQVRQKGNEISADLDGDGRREYFRSCTSGEGVHFTIWSGRPLKSKLRWHQYLSLGYDVTPTCTAAEVNSGKE